MTRSDVFEKLYNTYCSWYDMERTGEEKAPLRASGIFKSTDYSFMITRKAKMWSADSNDYLYVYDLDKLSASMFHEIIEQTKTMGEGYIHPHKNHKSSYITALFICSSADSDAVKALKKYRYRKDFAFGFKGWEEVHTALITVDDGSIYSNSDGLNTAKFLKSALFPK